MVITRSPGQLQELTDLVAADYLEHEFPDTDDELSYPSYAGSVARPSMSRVPLLASNARPDATSSTSSHPLVASGCSGPSPPLVGIPMDGMYFYGYCMVVPMTVTHAPAIENPSDFQSGSFSDFDDDLSESDTSSVSGGFCSDCINDILDDCEEPVLTAKCDDVCTICLDNFVPGHKDVCSFPVCRHMFHRECLETCLKRHPKCPNCRQRIL